MRSFITPAVVAVLAAAGVVGAQAQTTLTASNSSTVRPAGPRPVSSTDPANGTQFLNVEGNGNGANASFGIIDFVPTANASATSISNLVLNLTESNAVFTAPGTFNIYLASNTGSFSGFKFDSTQLSTGGIGTTQIGNLFLLGTGTFTSTGNPTVGSNTGRVDSFNLTLSSQDATNLFLSDVNTGSAVRLALGATTDTTAATFGGSTRLLGTAPTQVSAAPTLTFTANAAPPAVPEASTTASFGLLLVLGLGGVAVARRRKSA